MALILVASALVGVATLACAVIYVLLG